MAQEKNLDFVATWTTDQFKSAFKINGKVKVEKLNNDKGTRVWNVPDPEDPKATLTGWVQSTIDFNKPLFVSLTVDKTTQKEGLMLHNRTERETIFEW